MNLLWPSANIVSNAKLDLPEPDSPVITINCFFGIFKLIFFRLCISAPSMIISSLFCFVLAAILFNNPDVRIYSFCVIKDAKLYC